MAVRWYVQCAILRCAPLQRASMRLAQAQLTRVQDDDAPIQTPFRVENFKVTPAKKKSLSSSRSNLPMLTVGGAAAQSDQETGDKASGQTTTVRLLREVRAVLRRDAASDRSARRWALVVLLSQASGDRQYLALCSSEYVGVRCRCCFHDVLLAALWGMREKANETLRRDRRARLSPIDVSMDGVCAPLEDR